MRPSDPPPLVSSVLHTCPCTYEHIRWSFTLSAPPLRPGQCPSTPLLPLYHPCQRISAGHHLRRHYPNLHLTLSPSVLLSCSTCIRWFSPQPLAPSRLPTPPLRHRLTVIPLLKALKLLHCRRSTLWPTKLAEPKPKPVGRQAHQISQVREIEGRSWLKELSSDVWV
eukprot:SAG11_NODE_10879_length_799_cov_1.578571_1_plen_167_part_00